MLMLAAGHLCGALSLGLQLCSCAARGARGVRTHIRRLLRGVFGDSAALQSLSETSQMATERPAMIEWSPLTARAEPLICGSVVAS